MKTRPHSGAERRKQAILTAARAMLNREPLSMRRLAEAAGVSQATPYNLFGSKRQIFVELYALQRGELGARLAASEQPHAFARMLHAIHLFGQELEAEPAFFRAMMAMIYASPDDTPPAEAIEPGAAFWLDLVRSIQTEGLIASAINPDAFTAHFVYLLSGATIDWINHRVSVRQWETMVGYGLTLATLAVATPPFRAELSERMQRYESELTAFRLA